MNIHAALQELAQLEHQDKQDLQMITLTREGLYSRHLESLDQQIKEIQERMSQRREMFKETVLAEENPEQYANAVLTFQHRSGFDYDEKLAVDYCVSAGLEGCIETKLVKSSWNKELKTMSKLPNFVTKTNTLVPALAKDLDILVPHEN